MAPTFTAGQILRLRDGEIRIDRVTDDWIYFVQFSRIAETGAPTRMAPTLFAEAVAMQTVVSRAGLIAALRAPAWQSLVGARLEVYAEQIADVVIAYLAQVPTTGAQP